MAIRIRNWRQVFLFSAAITAVAVLVPLCVVATVMWPAPVAFKIPIMIISGMIPLLITVPISLFSLYLVKSLHQTMDTLDELIKFDPLTGVMARVHFLRQAQEHHKDKGFFALVDADHFKKINDTYGHDVGDIALKHIASTLMQVVGGHGFVGRMGGEEFAIRLLAVSRPQAELLMAAIGTKLRTEGVVHGHNLLKPTVSIGLAAEDGARSIANAMRSADSCLYKAKHKGRDQFVFEETLDEKAQTAA